MNKKIIITISIIFGLTVIVGGFLILQKTRKQEVVKNEQKIEVVENDENESKQDIENQEEDNQNNQEKVEELKVEDIDTSNWKEYCNQEYGFCVKYPEGWKVKKFNNNDPVVAINSPRNEQLLQEIKKKNQEKPDTYGEGYMRDVYISYYEKVTDYFDGAEKNNQKYTLKYLISNEIDTKFLNQFCVNNDCDFYSCIQYGFGAYYVVFIKHNYHLYRIMFGNVESEDKLSNIHKAILKSFRFID